LCAVVDKDFTFSAQTVKMRKYNNMPGECDDVITMVPLLVEYIGSHF